MAPQPWYGRFQSPEPPSNLACLHLHDGGTLHTVDHETPLGVLDQSDLLAQGIHTSHFIPGCHEDAEALGSCTAETLIETAAFLHPEPDFVKIARSLISESYVETAKSYSDVHGAQRAAIAFYHDETVLTGNIGEEWPPNDCGSSGPYIFSEAQRLGIVKSQKITHAGDGLISLLQSGPVLAGTPFFYSWEEPDAQGFIDGNGSTAALEAAIASGVAGGHEWYIAAVEKLVQLPTGHVDPQNTVLRARNHWTPQWGDHGCFRLHLSTLVALDGYCDFRQFAA